jgi:hypothetical protein
MRIRIVLAAAIGLWTASSLSAANAQEAIETDATKILTSMSNYLGNLEKFSVNYDTDFDIITPHGQKLKLAGSGNISVSRPGQFNITRLGTVANVKFNLDSGMLTVHGLKLDGYVQFPAKTIDEAITRVREDVGFSAPGADILSAKPFDMDLTDIVSGRHIGMTTIGGESVHHLAFRGSQLDWQLWVKDGDEPLPIKYVITSKLQAGAPEYSLLLKDWNSNPDLAENSFTFTPSATAKKLTGITIDETGTIISTWE